MGRTAGRGLFATNKCASYKTQQTGKSCGRVGKVSSQDYKYTGFATTTGGAGRGGLDHILL